MGFLANFLSHPVISGFISGASILILLSQFPHLLGLEQLPDSPAALREQWTLVNTLVLALGLAISRAADLAGRGVPVVGSLPAGLPALAWSTPDLPTLKLLLLPAALISLVSFVESVSIAQSLARRKRQSIDPDKELLALGAANVGSALTGGFAVCGGFSRSGLNIDAGSNTPLAGVVSAAVIAFIH